MGNGKRVWLSYTRAILDKLRLWKWDDSSKATVFVDPRVTEGYRVHVPPAAAQERDLNRYCAKSIFWMMSRLVFLLYTL